ncbi:NotI family restriction endonuclease [Chloroflexota bacterium]
MLKRASEIFGQDYDYLDVGEVVSSDYNCPFTSNKCNKQSRLLPYPMGTCAVRLHDKNVIICPQRYRENDIVFKDVANTFFGSTDNTIVFSEVRVNGIGSFDFVIVKHEPLRSTVADFVVVEFQSDSTTGTGKLVQNITDVINGDEVGERYNFGMNTYNTIKLSFIQMLMKGQAIEHWGKNIAWIMQDFIFSNMVRRFALGDSAFVTEKANHFFIYDLEHISNKYSLNLEEKHSYSVTDLIRAFQQDSALPSLSSFVKTLEERIKLHLEMS